MRRFWIGALMVASLLVPGIRAVSARQHGPEPTVTYVVQPGDSLWSIAGRVGDGQDRRRVVHSVMELNELRSATLLPGQKIRLPRP